MKSISELRSELNKVAEEYAKVIGTFPLQSKADVERRYKLAELALDAALFG